MLSWYKQRKWKIDVNKIQGSEPYIYPGTKVLRMFPKLIEIRDDELKKMNQVSQIVKTVK